MLFRSVSNEFSDRCKVVFIFHPTQSEVEKNENVYAGLIHKLQIQGIDVINLYQYYSNRSIKSHIATYYWREGHHNPEGYKLMAEGIYKGLIENHIVSADSVVHVVN